MREDRPKRRRAKRRATSKRPPAATPLEAAGNEPSKRTSDGRAKERRSATEILRELKLWIAAKEKEFGPGVMLPSVSALAARTGACRPTVRKVLVRLTDERLIQWAGRRAFVAPTASATVILEGLAGKRVRRRHPRDEEILDCRRWLEPEGAVRATELARMSTGFREKLKVAFESIERGQRIDGAESALRKDRVQLGQRPDRGAGGALLARARAVQPRQSAAGAGAR